MRTVKNCLLFGLTLSLLGLALPSSGEEKPKYTIKEVMMKAHGKDGLLNKVKGGKADKAQKEELVALYTALAANKPPKGEATEWKQKTEAVLKAAKAVASGKDGADADLGKATNCKACHSVFK